MLKNLLSEIKPASMVDLERLYALHLPLLLASSSTGHPVGSAPRHVPSLPCLSWANGYGENTQLVSEAYGWLVCLIIITQWLEQVSLLPAQSRCDERGDCPTATPLDLINWCVPIAIGLVICNQLLELLLACLSRLWQSGAYGC